MKMNSDMIVKEIHNELENYGFANREHVIETWCSRTIFWCKSS